MKTSDYPVSGPKIEPWTCQRRSVSLSNTSFGYHSVETWFGSILPLYKRLSGDYLSVVSACIHGDCGQCTRGAQKVLQHIYFLGPVLLDKNNILRAAAFKFPAFLHLVARFPAR
jgi:hypothetical protein